MTPTSDGGPIGMTRSFREVNRLTTRAETLARDRAATADVVAEAWQAVLDHPCSSHQVDRADVFDEMHQALRRGGRFDEAIGAKRAAIDAGYQSLPDPEADIAEILIVAGRHDEATALYEVLRDRDPDDVWLYNSAAFSWTGVNDHHALEWATTGIDVAIATGDPDRVIDQLLDFTHTIWDRLGQEPAPALVGRVRRFENAWARPPPRPWPTGAVSGPDHSRPCDHCGYHPDQPQEPDPDVTARAIRNIEQARRTTAPSPRPARDQMQLSVGWFPTGEWDTAIGRWPDLADTHGGDDDPEGHRSYSHRIEANLKTLAAVHGHNPRISPITVHDLDQWADEHDNDPGSGAARAGVAAELARTGRSVPWPPGRNDRCWCGSGQKYKRCCGPIPARPLDPDS